MKRLLANSLITIFYLIFLSVLIVGQEIKIDTKRIFSAEGLWELAIAAKGGREALSKITSIADLGNQNGTSSELVVMPDRYFYWWDTRPSPYGIISRLYNLETGFGCKSATNHPPQVYKDIRGELRLPKDPRQNSLEFLGLQFDFLMETRWLHPKPLTATKVQIEGKRLDRVDVLIEGYGTPVRYAVFLDEKTHLPMRLALCRDVNTDEIMENGRMIDFRKYIPIKGIMIPTEVSIDKKKWRPKYIELNVDYDPQFFDRVPDYNKNGLQWRKDGAIQATLKATLSSLPDEDLTRYLRDLNADNTEVQQVAVRELGSAGKQVEPQLIQLLTIGSAQQRYHATVLLLQLDEQHAQALAHLAQLVLDKRLSPQFRQDATFGLLRNDEGIRLLTGLLNHSDLQVRRYTIFAFDQLTERAQIPPIVERALPLLRDLTKDDDPVIREMAKEVVQQIRKRKKD